MATELDPADILVNLLAEHGPLTEDDLLARLQEAGAADADLDELLDDIGEPASQLRDERWVWLPALLAGRIFTHRLTADEAAHDLLVACPDLDPLVSMCNDAFGEFIDGTPVDVLLPQFDEEFLVERGIPVEDADEHGMLPLPLGTLAGLGVSDGDLIGLRLTEQGITVERVDAVADATVGERLPALLDDEPVLLDEAVWTLCAADPTLFTTPLAPLSDIIDDAGLQQRGDLLAPAEFSFATWDFNHGCTRLANRHDLAPDEALALYVLVTLHRQFSELLTADSDEDLVSPQDSETSPWVADFTDLQGDVGAVLADPRLAEILVSEALDRGRIGAAGLGILAETLEPKVPRAARVACRWMRAVALERTGDVEGAEEELLAAESMDTNWSPALQDLARFASDRGDAERALALLRRSGTEPDDQFVQLLEKHRLQPRADIGRNDVCWCGSGRKYKKCHLGREQLPLAERVDWLYGKASHYALVNGWDTLLNAASYERARYAATRQEKIAALTDPLLMDSVLFEGGAFDEFVAARGDLLPDDERLLAGQWQLAQRSVFEVEQVRPGQGLTVRDVRTGDTHDVQEKSASRQLKDGHLICARVLPTGESMVFFGGIEPVALHERDPLIELLDAEPGALELVAFLTRRFAPPTVTNTEGEPLLLCQAAVQVSDPGAIETALDAAYERLDDEVPPRWHEYVASGRQIRALLVLDGDTARVDTNSAQRMDRVLAALTRLDPGLTVLEDVRRPISDEMPGRPAESDPAALDPSDPEVVAALDKFIRDYEISWLDEQIPALDGYTPRQAAEDPTRRGDLIKLLDSFPSGAAARGGMDADRLRTDLGLA